MIKFDTMMGGVGLHNINNGGSGRYHVKERDIFRPIQYIKNETRELRMGHSRDNSYVWITFRIINKKVV